MEMETLLERLSRKEREEKVNRLIYRAIRTDSQYTHRVTDFLSNSDRAADRQAFFALLMTEPYTAKELQNKLGIPESTAYIWMKRLREEGVAVQMGTMRHSNKGGPNAQKYYIPGIEKSRIKRKEIENE